MFVIKVKDKDHYVCRKPYKIVGLNDCQTYRSESAAKIALKASKGPFPDWNMGDLGITDWDQLEIREVILTLK